MEKDEEKTLSATPTHTGTMDEEKTTSAMPNGTLDEEKARSAMPGGTLNDEPEFAPIRTEPLSKPATNRSSASRGLDRLRSQSQNGYGCSDEHGLEGEGGSTGDEEAQVGVPEKDPFEVGWDNGDSDPLSPRSFTRARKWLIVAIVAFASFCV